MKNDDGTTLGEYLEKLPKKAEILLNNEKVDREHIESQDFYDENKPVLLDTARHGAELVYLVSDGGGTGDGPVFRVYRKGLPDNVEETLENNRRANTLPADAPAPVENPVVNDEDGEDDEPDDEPDEK